MLKTNLKIKKTIKIFIISVFFLIFGKNCLSANPLDITIIEIGAYKKNQYEYIKIYNNTQSNINLKGWKFKEGFSSSKPNGISHSLKEYNGQGFVLPPESVGVICQNPLKFLEEEDFSGLILDSSWGSLNENGEKILISDSEGKIIEEFFYLEAKNGPLKRKNYSLADYSADNWYEDTKNAQNKNEKNNSDNPTDSSNVNIPNKTSNTYSIIINEIFPNPAGPDNEKEFIELKNIGDTTVNLENWKIKDNSQRVYIIKEKYYNLTFIRPQKFFVIYRSKSRIALNNFKGDEIKLYDSQDRLVDKINYSEKAPPEQSYSRDHNDQWRFTPFLTPGKENIVPKKNNPPVGEIEISQKDIQKRKINFDASDSYDPDGDDLFFIWHFGDGHTSTLINPQHTYDKGGTYKVKLFLFDNRDAKASTSLSIKIPQKENNLATATSSKKFLKILITEIFPNPAGRDTDEFIEIYNPHQEKVNLTGWTIKDNTKNGWSFPQNTFIEGKSYLVLYREETHLTLNNNKDTIKLLNPLGEISYQISYKNAPEEMSYALNINQNQWAWTYEITPEEENEIIRLYKTESFDMYSPFSDNYEKSFPIPVPLDAVSSIAEGENVETDGIVIVEPGIFGKQIFYLNGMQVYMHSQNFPKLKTGYKIKIIGEIGKIREEKRIKIKKKEDIIILEKNIPQNIPFISINEINEKLSNKLVTVKGEITEKKNRSFWIDDNTGEINVYLHKNTKISSKKFKTGQWAEVTGLVQKFHNDLRLLPRYPQDIKIGKVLGKTTFALNEKKPTKNSFSFWKKEFNKYFYVTLIGALIIVFNLIKKRKKKN